MTNWSQLRPLSKLDQLAETIMKSAFLLSENHLVIQSYLNHYGAHFKVQNRVGEQEYDILCRQINVEKTNYAFLSKKDLERGLRDDLWIGLVLFVDNQKPTKYLFPSTVWNAPNQLFTDSAVKNPEYGINLIRILLKCCRSIVLRTVSVAFRQGQQINHHNRISFIVLPLKVNIQPLESP